MGSSSSIEFNIPSPLFNFAGNDYRHASMFRSKAGNVGNVGLFVLLTIGKIAIDCEIA